MIKAIVLYVGFSLLSLLRRAEREINSQYCLGLCIACYNCTLPLTGSQWFEAERDLGEADVVFVFHVTDNENAARIGGALDRFRPRQQAVIVINCLGDLMRRIRLGHLDFSSLFTRAAAEQEHSGYRMIRKVALWMSGHA